MLPVTQTIVNYITCTYLWTVADPTPGEGARPRVVDPLVVALAAGSEGEAAIVAEKPPGRRRRQDVLFFF